MALDITKHKNILIKILKEIYTDSSLGPVLGFKGGTAAHLFYNLPRFSVDLDFDLLDEGKKKYVFSRVEQIVRSYGQIKEARKKRFNLFFLLSYGEKSPNIKVEINRRSFGSQYELKTYLGISMLVMEKENMFAHKLVAMTERKKTANRDVFDVWFFLKKDWEIDKKIVEKRTEMKFKDYLKKCIKSIKDLPERGILSGMGELLDDKTKVWAKENLKKDVVFLLKLKLENEKNKNI